MPGRLRQETAPARDDKGSGFKVVNYSAGRLRKLVFGISPEEASASRRGFRCRDERARARLEKIGVTFLQGYHAALEAGSDDALMLRLEAVESEFRGFAFEGAAMGLALLDFIKPWARTRLKRFVEGAGAAHVYMLFVGAGWAMARLRRDPARTLRNFDPLLGWLAVDGYGFHEGYFKWPAYVARQERPRRLSGYTLRVFDQGLGRSLWFVEGADAERIIGTINAFAPERRSDLWSGVGLACAYAGGADDAALALLRDGAGGFAAQLAQGAAFAAKARQRAGNMAAHTEAACRLLCGMTAAAAAEATDAALRLLPRDALRLHARGRGPAQGGGLARGGDEHARGGDEPAYEIWRRRIAEEMTRGEVLASRRRVAAEASAASA